MREEEAATGAGGDEGLGRRRGLGAAPTRGLRPRGPGDAVPVGARGRGREEGDRARDAGERGRDGSWRRGMDEGKRWGSGRVS